MRITFLGTGAAEGYPALWCRCQRCTVARERGGRHLRFRSAALVNDDLLLDAGPDVVAGAIRHGLDLATVQAVLVTHPHSDHLDPTMFQWRRRGFVTTPLPLLHLYGSARTMARVAQPEGREVSLEAARIAPHTFRAFERFRIETGGPAVLDDRFPEDGAAVPETPPRRYDVWTLGASHAQPEDEACIFVIRQVSGPELQRSDGLDDRSGRVLFYATDTGPFSPQTWEALGRLGREGLRFDATAIDSTLGAGKDGASHMSLSQMAEHQQELSRRGLLAPQARRLAHHFSHGATPPHDELCALLEPQGIEAAYDGLSLTL